VTTAALKRLSEALRTIEEYCKVIAPTLTERIERMRYNGYTLEGRMVSRIHVADHFRQVRLYVLITPSLCKGSIREIARRAISGGADAIQLRAKDLPDAQVLALAAELRELCDETGRILIINDRADIAALVGADGLHLGQQDLPIAEVRRLLRPGALVGRSSHSIEQARAAVTEGADYVSVGPMFPTATKDRPVVGPELLRQVAAEVTLPVAAIGGITADNAHEMFQLGASCVAVSSAICSAADPQSAAAGIKKAITPK
jgi:thiamine-phosphate pyrophosphorylase